MQDWKVWDFPNLSQLFIPSHEEEKLKVSEFSIGWRS